MADHTAQLLKEVVLLQKKIDTAALPADLREKAVLMVQRISRLARYGEYSREYEKVTFFIDWVVNLVKESI